MYAAQGIYTAALDFLTFAIEHACMDVLQVEPSLLSEMYLQRVKCYEGLNLFEHAKADNRKILEADPGFLQRQIAKQKKAQEDLKNTIQF